MKTELRDEICFFVGVLNVIFSTWIMSSVPYLYWIWHTLKNLGLLVFRYFLYVQKGWQYYLLDFCYVVNYLSILYFIAVFVFNCMGMSASISYFSNLAFRLFFIWAMGPLAMAIALFRNSLVFHSVDHMTILAVHVGPPLSFYGMRWFLDGVSDITWLEMFSLDFTADSMFSLTSLFDLVIIPLIGYVLIWQIPYFLIIFVFSAETIREHHYQTVYSIYEESLAPYFDSMNVSKGLRPVAYMLLHGTLCFIAFLIAYLMWNSFVLNTIYLIVLIGISVWNGSTFYFHVFAKKYAKEREQSEKVSLGDQELSYQESTALVLDRSTLRK